MISQLNQTKFENAEILLSYDPDKEFGDDTVATKTNSLTYEQLSGKIRGWMKIIVRFPVSDTFLIMLKAFLLLSHDIFL